VVGRGRRTELGGAGRRGREWAATELITAGGAAELEEVVDVTVYCCFCCCFSVEETVVFAEKDFSVTEEGGAADRDACARVKVAVATAAAGDERAGGEIETAGVCGPGVTG